MVMGFTIFSAALEWMGGRWETIQKEAEERKQRQKELDEEEEKVDLSIVRACKGTTLV